MSIFEHTIRLIKEHGERLTLTRKTGDAVDPVTGIRSSGVESTYPTYGKSVEDKQAILRAFNSVGTTDRVFLLDTTIEPQIGDKITANGQRMTVKEFQIHYFKGQVVYYTVRLVA